MSWKEHRSEIWAEVWLESRPFQWGVICIAGACCALRVLQAGNLSALCSFVLDFTLASGLMFCVMQQWMSHKIQNIAKVSAMEMIGQRSWDEALAGGKEDHREGPQTDKLQEPDQEDEEDEYEDEPQLQAGSPADLILEVLDLIIAGGMPHSHDLHLLRDSILRGALHKAMYQPLDLGQDLHRLIMEPDVEASLYQQLLGCTMTPRDAGEPAQECLQPGIKQGPPSMRTISGKLTAASSLEGELEEEPVGSEGFLAKILTSLASDTGGILKARHLPPGRSKSSTFLSKLMVLQKGRRLSYRDELKPSKRVSETIMGDPSLMVLEDGPSTGRSSPTTGACLKPAPASKMLKDPPTSPPQGTLDLLLSKVRPSGQNCSSSSRRSSWHVMNMNAAELDSSLPYDDTAAEDRRASTASVRSSGGEEKGGVQGSKSKRRWSVGWQLQEQLQEQQEQPMQQLLHGHDSLAHPLREEMDHVLGLAYDNFSFDAFKLAAVTQGHPLSTLAFYLFHKNNLITGFNLHAVKLARFLRNIEAGYCPKNPYHSAIHAADVLQTLHVVMQQGGIVPQYADRLSLMAALMAAIMHDYEHMGLTNDFLVNNSSPLAIRYNDRAPLENHHLAAGFTVLHSRDHNFLDGLPKAEYSRLRKIVIDLVLATDMKQHFALVGQFNAVVRRVMPRAKPQDPGPSPNSPRARTSAFGHSRDKPMGRALSTNLSVLLDSQNLSVRRHPAASTPVSGEMFPSIPHRNSMDVTESALSQLKAATQDASARIELLTPRSTGRSIAASLPSFRDRSTGGEITSADRMTMGDRSTHGECTPSGDHTTSGENSIQGRDRHTGGSEGPVRGSSTSGNRESPSSLDESQKLLLLQIALKCADLGHVAEDHDVHIRWVHALEEEFYRQGDREKAAKLPVSPLFDRDKPGVTKSQVGFFDVVVLPLFQALTGLLPGVQPLLDGVEANYRFWKAEQQQQQQQQQQQRE
mmetsp:Transcript_29009/g.75040  ORF Transcript_29009/g.75040 Transcript_29009/m.75040 type:complete len:974 (+) Transcript_29009:37-2958(+)